MTDSDSHGTSVAGQIAMVRDNGYCGVGVAYDAKYAGNTSLYAIVMYACMHARL